MSAPLDKATLIALRPFATTEFQVKVLEAVITHGTMSKAAKYVDSTQPKVSKILKRIRNRAALHDGRPGLGQERTSSGLHVVKGESTLYDQDGNMRLSWVKTDVTKTARMQLLQEWVESLVESVGGLKDPAPTPAHAAAEILSAYVIGDHHLGMYAWHEESGEDYDLATGRQVLVDAMDELVASAPDSDTALIVNLGDFFHADTPDNRTAASGHPLDVDTRHAKVFRTGCEAFEQLVDRALRKHRKVIVFITKGNHDPESSFALAEVLSAVYRREPRVDVRGGVKFREYYEFGRNLIGVCHGDKAKPAILPGLMAAEQPEAWGRTTCRRWLVGHFHHQDRKEHAGCIVEIFPTLAAKDAWHASMGYISERAMTCLVFHREHGEVGRRLIGVPELTRKQT